MTSLGLAAALAASATVSTSLDCVRLQGEAKWVARVAGELLTQRPCKHVEVTIRAANSGIVVEMAGAASRPAATPLVAAAIIESWTNASIVADLLQGPPAGPKNSPSPLLNPDPTADAVTVNAQPEEPLEPAQPLGQLGRLGALLRFEGGIAEEAKLDGSLFARADLRLDGLTPWVGARLAVLPSAITHANGNAGQRSGGELLVGLELPFAVAGFIVAPGIAGGAGYSKTSRAQMPSPQCTVAACADIGAPLLQDHFSHVSFGPRFELGVRASRAILGQLALDVGLSANYAPLADRGLMVPDYASELPAAEQQFFALPVESRFGLRLGLGLRWGTW